MIYDEAFDIILTDLNFFSFFNYKEMPNSNNNQAKKDYGSLCYSTTVGWYHNKDKTKWGCFRATKLGVDAEKIVYSNTKNNVVVVENRVENINTNTNTNTNSKTNNNNDGPIIPAFGNFRFPEFDENKENKTKKLGYFRKRESELYNFEDQFSFLALNEKIKDKVGVKSLLKLTATFKNHAAYVDRINEVKKSWIADVPKDFNELTLKQLNDKAGRKKSSMLNYRFKSFSANNNKSSNKILK